MVFCERKLVSHSWVKMRLLGRWILQDQRYAYTMGLVLFLVAFFPAKGSLSQKVVLSLVAAACWILLAHIIEFMDRRILKPLREEQLINLSAWEWVVLIVLGAMILLPWLF